MCRLENPDDLLKSLVAFKGKVTYKICPFDLDLQRKENNINYVDLPDYVIENWKQDLERRLKRKDQKISNYMSLFTYSDDDQTIDLHLFYNVKQISDNEN